MMQPEIEGEDEEYVKVYCTDNGGIEHELTVQKESGEIAYHSQDGYADHPSDRTMEETEHGNQARRYAKWHVYRELGYQTLPRYENPDAIVGAMLAIGATPTAKIDEHFGALLDKLRRHDKGQVSEGGVDNVDPEEVVAYRQNVYLESDPLAEEPPLAEQFAEYFSDPAETVDNVFGEGEPSFKVIADLLAGNAEPVKALPEFEIESVSDVQYLDGESVSEQPQIGESDREPDATIELLPLDPAVFDSPRELLFSHLGNQVRDRYLLMGAEPPEAFQQQGLGTFDGTKKQQLLDMYDEYYLAEDSVSSWQPAKP